jgi:peptidyl-tRNA hydrolase, PTH1 family
MKLIVWLGNPWKEYEKTRHNIWFIMLERFVEAEKLGNFSFDKKYMAETLSPLSMMIR